MLRRNGVGNRSGDVFDRLLEVRVRGVGGEERLDLFGGGAVGVVREGVATKPEPCE